MWRLACFILSKFRQKEVGRLTVQVTVLQTFKRSNLARDGGGGGPSELQCEVKLVKLRIQFGRSKL